jgi:hypothetical protein
MVGRDVNLHLDAMGAVREGPRTRRRRRWYVAAHPVFAVANLR